MGYLNVLTRAAAGLAKAPASPSLLPAAEPSVMPQSSMNDFWTAFAAIAAALTFAGGALDGVMAGRGQVANEENEFVLRGN